MKFHGSLATATAVAFLAVPTFAFAQTAPTATPLPATAPAAAHAHHGLAKMLATLNLTPDQQAQIKTIDQKYHAQNATVIDPAMRRANGVAQRADIMAVLTPAQKTQLDSEMAAAKAERKAASKHSAPVAPLAASPAPSPAT